jgi:hypothetical protein
MTTFLKYSVTMFCLWLLGTGCDGFKPIEYEDPRAVADRAFGFIRDGQKDSVIAIIHPDNYRKMPDGALETIMAEGRQLFINSETGIPDTVKITTGEAYNLGGQVDITTFEYELPDATEENADDPVDPSIHISVAKGKVIGITVAK